MLSSVSCSRAPCSSVLSRRSSSADVRSCSSTSSRNFSLGKAIGEGQSATDLMADRHTVAEGAHTAPVLQRLAREKGIEMPIVDAVVALLDGAGARSIVDDLLARPLTTERRSA